jgi:hypothetical protein
VTALLARRLCSALFPAALGLLSATAGAQSAGATGPGAPTADQGVTKPSGGAANPDAEALPAYHHSLFSWEHSVTAQTLGVGDTPQSANPTYTMGLVAKTRYYFLDDTLRGRHFSLRLDGGLYREFTNSDTTTRRGELGFSDTNLGLVYMHRVRGSSSADSSLAELRPLTLALPTSKASFDSGRYFAPGVVVGITNVSPLLQGKIEPEISSLVRFAVGYERWFARATVPTNPSLERVRLTPDGRSLPGDSLSGASLVRDQLEASLRLRFDFGKRVYWISDFAAAAAWKYNVQNEVQLCGVVLTGCTTVRGSDDESRYMVATAFSTEVSVAIGKGFSVELGYGNAALQIGADGRRRGFFYSPDAVFFTSVSFFPHELASPRTQIAAKQPASLTF